MKKAELLAPAGDLEKLKMAIIYGADAVYMAGKSFGLRKASKNFTKEIMKEAVEFAHKRNKKIYITMNIIPHNENLEGLDEYINDLKEIGVDAIIVADTGMYYLIRKIDKDIEIHISTQANITNYGSVAFWRDLGASRAILAREMSLEDIKYIKNKVKNIEIESFVHGAMCISYSGRCLLSNYMCGRDANLGDCAQACRWKYHLVEEKRPGEYYPIEEDENGTYIYNSKDLCTLDIIPQIIESGVDSLKIEGRVKSSYYVATVVRSYRRVIDAYYEGTFSKELAKKMLDEIKKVSYRDFTHGFYLNKPDEKDQLYKSSSYIRTYDFIGIVIDYDQINNIATIEQRNKFSIGDELEHISPDNDFQTFKISNMYNEKGESIKVAPHAKEIIKIKVEFPMKKYDILRRKK